MAQQPKKSNNLKIEAINTMAELDRLGVKYEPVGPEEIKILCPVHEDKSPSCCINVKKNLWTCKSAECMAKGDIISLLAYIAGVTRDVIILDLTNRYDIAVKKSLNPEIVEKFHADIWNAGPLLKELYDRGVTDSLIRKARLGLHQGRITIPIFDRDGSCVDIRRYLPGAPGPEKMKNTPGYGGFHLYQVDQLHAFNDIIICGGEMKALVAGGLLNQHGVGAVAGTTGEGAWDSKVCALFKGKRVWVCLDVDKGGLAGSRVVAGFVFTYAASTRIMRLPLDKVKYPKGDINDFVGREKATDKDLLKCMAEAEEWYPPEIKEDKDTGQPKPVQLSEATNAENVGKKIEISGIVNAMDTTPYLIPKTVMCSCDKNQPMCSFCPVKPKEPEIDTGRMRMEIKATSQGILEMVNAPKKSQREAIIEALHIPTCKVVEFFPQDFFNITDVRLSPQLNIGSESSKNVVQPGLLVGTNIEMNTPYTFKGKVYPHPKNQQAILLLDDVTLGQDNLGSYKPIVDELKKLKIFRPKQWTEESLKEKIEDIYNDFETNVTRVYYRQDMHLIMDLCYHSVLVFPFDQEEVKGWANILIVGDSSQGKSRVAEMLMKHYGLGEKMECKNATVAGLLGGLHQVGTRWFVAWGIIPTHDRRLVILEEIGGTDAEVLTKLTDMRSSGVAEIPKIEKRRALARTRLIFISNPRSGRSTSGYNFGVEIIKELMNRPEDIRRLDVAMVVSSSQVDPEAINRLSENRPVREHKYLKNLCQTLVLWAWTRAKEQVIFEGESMKMILAYATALSSKYTDAIPLVDRGTIRHKIAKLAVALAARTFSTSDDMTTLIVRPCHVDFIYHFLDRLYGDPVFGYLDFSSAQVHANSVVDADLVTKQILATKHPSDFVDQLLYTDEISLNDIGDWCETDRDQSQKILSMLVRKHAVYRVKRWYVKTSEFIQLLKKVKEAGFKDLPKKKHTQKEEF